MTRSRFLDPTNDVAFKRLFSDKEILKDFLNAVLRLPEGHKIKELQFIPVEELPPFGFGKRSIFDVKCCDEAGNWYVVEMQNRSEKAFLKRAQYYAAHAYVSQGVQGKTHDGFMPVILVALSKYKLFDDSIGYISYHKTFEEETKQHCLYDMSYVFIELPKFTKKEKELKTIEDYWLYFFSQWSKTNEPPENLTDECIVKAYKTLDQFNWTEGQYDAYVRARLAAEAEELSLNKSFEEGIEAGLEKIKPIIFYRF